MGKLQGKSILLTGGGSGIGLASAKALCAEGAKVMLVGRTEAKLQAAAKEIGANCSYGVADVSDALKVQAVVKQMLGSHGQIDILINNAGLNIKERGIRQL